MRQLKKLNNVSSNVRGLCIGQSQILGHSPIRFSDDCGRIERDSGWRGVEETQGNCSSASCDYGQHENQKLLKGHLGKGWVLDSQVPHDSAFFYVLVSAPFPRKTHRRCNVA